MSGNDVTLVGNCTRDPDLRFTPSGQAVVNFGVAVNRRWKEAGSTEWSEEVSFFEVVAWRELAENTAESITKGARIFVTGRLEQQTWENAEGEKRSKVIVVADDVGPSLRWATAEITKNERRGGSAPVRDAPPGYHDEEPF